MSKYLKMLGEEEKNGTKIRSSIGPISVCPEVKIETPTQVSSFQYNSTRLSGLEPSENRTNKNSSLTLGAIAVSPEVRMKSPAQVSSFEYNGTTYFQNMDTDVPSSFQQKPNKFGSNYQLSSASFNSYDGSKFALQRTVELRSHRTPLSRLDPRSMRGSQYSWPRKPVLPSFGENEFNRNLKSGSNRFGAIGPPSRRVSHGGESEDTTGDLMNNSQLGSSWTSSLSPDSTTPRYTKSGQPYIPISRSDQPYTPISRSGQPYVPISIANCDWYRRRSTDPYRKQDKSQIEMTPRQEFAELREVHMYDLDTTGEKLVKRESDRIGQVAEEESHKSEVVMGEKVKKDEVIKGEKGKTDGEVKGENFKTDGEVKGENFKTGEVVKGKKVKTDEVKGEKVKTDEVVKIETSRTMEIEMLKHEGDKCSNLEEALGDLTIKELKSLNITKTSAETLLQTFEPMVESWKKVLSDTDNADKNLVVNEGIQENDESTMLIEKEVRHIPQTHKESKSGDEIKFTPGASFSPLPQDLKDNLGKNQATKKKLDVQGSSFGGSGFSDSYSPATGLHLIEVWSTSRNYVFTVGDRGDITRLLSPLVKQIIIINTFQVSKYKSHLHMGVLVDDEDQFYAAIQTANSSFRSREFQFRPFFNRRDILKYLARVKEIPTVDSNGVYPITVKFALPKGNEAKAEASLSRELERKVWGCGVEKISIGPGERILQIGHVVDMMKTSEKVKGLFEVIPSKHIWENEERKRKKKEERKKNKELKRKKKEREATEREEKIKKQKEGDKNKQKRGELETEENGNPKKQMKGEIIKRDEKGQKKKERNVIEREEIWKDLEIKGSLKPNSNKVTEFETLDHILSPIKQENKDSTPLLSNQSKTLTLINCDDDSDTMEITQHPKRELAARKDAEGCIICRTSEVVSSSTQVAQMVNSPALKNTPHRDEENASPLKSFVELMEDKESRSSLKLLQGRFVQCPNDNEENEHQAFQLLEKAITAEETLQKPSTDGDDYHKEMLEKTEAAEENLKKPSTGEDVYSKEMLEKAEAEEENLKKHSTGEDDNLKEMLEKTEAAGETADTKAAAKDDNLKDMFKTEDSGETVKTEVAGNDKLKNVACQLGEGNRIIFQSIIKNKVDMVEEDAKWYGDVSSIETIESKCSQCTVQVTFQAKEETEAAYFGLREKYNSMIGKK